MYLNKRLHFLLKVHTFYEAVGIMISAQVNSKIQEQLIDKYMLLPNLIWDDCISQASKVIIKLITIS